MTLENNSNLAAKAASGSARFDAYVVCPASGTTIGKIAAGISDNLATRSALVAMKERRKLIIVPREAPYCFEEGRVPGLLLRLGLDCARALQPPGA